MYVKETKRTFMLKDMVDFKEDDRSVFCLEGILFSIKGRVHIF